MMTRVNAVKVFRHELGQELNLHVVSNELCVDASFTYIL
jgi:hypothetical protein